MVSHEASGTDAPVSRTGRRGVARQHAEVVYRRLGGLDQWVMVRGESIANPSLILLHGGPGLSETRFFRRFNAPLEKSFTVVYWDHRGAGKSFYPDIPRSSMTVDQFISDLDDLVEAVCERLGKAKVVIFGHSWGSALGVLYASRFPQKVAAYVGSGQYGAAAAGETASYAYGLAEAERRGNRRALNKLREIGPPPHTAEQLMTERTWVTRLGGGMRPRAWPNLARIALGVRESSIFDLPPVEPARVAEAEGAREGPRRRGSHHPRCPGTRPLAPARRMSQSSIKSAPARIACTLVMTLRSGRAAPPRPPRSTASSWSPSRLSRSASVASGTLRRRGERGPSSRQRRAPPPPLLPPPKPPRLGAQGSGPTSSRPGGS